MKLRLKNGEEMVRMCDLKAGEFAVDKAAGHIIYVIIEREGRHAIILNDENNRYPNIKDNTRIVTRLESGDVLVVE